jgi:CubicO group peptidase (beta-lactamase class C family)
MTSAMQDLLERHVASGTVPGAVASLGRAELEIVAAGAMSVGGAPMRADAIMRMQSMTKAVTTVAALRLVEAGSLRLDKPMERWLPELADRQVLKSPTADLADTSPAVPAITLRHLLTNTSGYGMVLTECPLQRAMADSEIDIGGRGLALPPLLRHPRSPYRSSGRPAVAGSPSRRPARTPRPPRAGQWVSAGSVARCAGQLPAHRLRSG